MNHVYVALHSLRSVLSTSSHRIFSIKSPERGQNLFGVTWLVHDADGQMGVKLRCLCFQSPSWCDSIRNHHLFVRRRIYLVLPLACHHLVILTCIFSQLLFSTPVFIFTVVFWALVSMYHIVYIALKHSVFKKRVWNENVSVIL